MRPAILISTRQDGTMKGEDRVAVLHNRRQFLEMHGHNPSRSTIVRLNYEGSDYCRYQLVEDAQHGDGVTHEMGAISDALLTNNPEVSLFLPLADCVGVVLYDEAGEWLMVSHLGRHNLEQDGGRKSAEYFVSETGVPASRIKVYMTPAAGKINYPLFAFSNRSLHEVATEQLRAAGIERAHIEIDARDTTNDYSLYSHSEFLRGNRESDGRFMVVARLHP